MTRRGHARPLVLLALTAGVAIPAYLAGRASAPEGRHLALQIATTTHRAQHLDRWHFYRADLRGYCWRGWLIEECTFEGTDLRGADFRGASFCETDLSTARLEGADLAGADFDIYTRWPAGFDPRAHGAALDE